MLEASGGGAEVSGCFSVMVVRFNTEEAILQLRSMVHMRIYLWQNRVLC